MILPLEDTFIHSTRRNQILLALHVLGEHHVGDMRTVPGILVV